MANFWFSFVQEVAHHFPDGLFYKPTELKWIALTIDDAPSPADPHGQETELILRAIADFNTQVSVEQQARATFFLITDHIGEQTDLVRRIVAAGHEVANHGTQDERHAELSQQDFERIFWQAHTALSDIIQQPIRWYRPGQGLYNEEMLAVLHAAPGYVPLMAEASNIPLDTRKPLQNQLFTVAWLSQFIFPGAIWVLHGGTLERAQNTATALRELLWKLYEQGYRAVTLSQLWDQA
jgi:peptidoglycan/xylan/chitin deacetylase (PgdA/CDA1 family)